MSYDPFAETLAKRFLSSFKYTPEQLAALAQAIQDAAEDWLTAEGDGKGLLQREDDG